MMPVIREDGAPVDAYADEPESHPEVQARLARELAADGVRVARVGGKLLIGRKQVRAFYRSIQADQRRARRAAATAKRVAERQAGRS